MNIYSKITRINTCTGSTLLEKSSPKGILTYYSCQGSDFFSLSRVHDMLITSFLISSPSLKFTTDLWYSKYFNIFPNSSKLKWSQPVSWKGSYMCLLLFIFSKLLILVNGNLSVILSLSPLALGYSYRTLYMFFSSERQKPWGMRKMAI